jgi:putative endonuclease
MYYTYILKSLKNGKLYIGQTRDLEKRLIRHNIRQNKSTKDKRPWELIYSKGFETRSEAIIHELKLKSMKNNSYLLNNLDNI